MIEQSVAGQDYFLRDVSALRARAKIFLDGQTGAPFSVELLQTVLAAEIVCVLRYTNISVSAAGLRNGRVGAEFQEQANDERRHMMMAAQRIEELGGTPDFEPAALMSRHAAAFDGAQNLATVIEQNLLAEQSVVEHYRDLIGYFSERDPATCAMLERILQDEENHTADMQDMLVSH
jgi:bacterioferritin